MAQPTRFPNGLSVDKVFSPLGDLIVPNPTRIAMYANDFFSYAAGDWTVNAGGAGSGAALSNTPGPNGWLTLTTATSGAESIAQNPATFNFTQGTSTLQGLKTWFSTRVLLDATVANPDYQLGLTAGSLTALNSATDGVYFTKATGATVWSLVIKASSTATTIALPAVTVPSNSQVLKLSYLFDGTKNLLYVFFNDTMIGTVGTNGSLGTDLSNLPASTVLLSPSALNAFHTGTSLLSLDFIVAAVERT